MKWVFFGVDEADTLYSNVNVCFYEGMFVDVVDDVKF